MPNQTTPRDRRPSISYAILMFNEEKNIASCLEKTLSFLDGALEEFEIIVVDDGSTDGSTAIVEQVATDEKRIRLIRHEKNRGMGAGIKTAIENAEKDFFIYNAADGQVAPDELEKMIPLLGGADMVLSTYAGRRETLTRELISRAFRVYMKAACGIRFKHQGLILYPTSVAKVVAPRVRANTFFFAFELVQRGIENGLVPATAEIVCEKRESGGSKVARPGRILKVATEAASYGLRKRILE